MMSLLCETIEICFVTGKLLCVCSCRTLNLFMHDDAVYGLAVDPINEDVFASACDDGKVHIYDLRAPASEGLHLHFF